MSPSEATPRTPVTAHLDAMGVPYRVKPHGEAVFTSEEAARERGVPLSRIVKTMVLTNRRGDLALAVLPGDRKLDLRKVKNLAGLKDLHLMEREAVAARFGVTVGAIAPIPALLGGASLFVDPAVFSDEPLDISSGDPGAGLELSREALRIVLSSAVVADITKAEKPPPT